MSFDVKNVESINVATNPFVQDMAVLGEAKLQPSPNVMAPVKEYKEYADLTNKVRDNGVNTRDTKRIGVAAIGVAVAFVALAVFVFVATSGFLTVGMGAVLIGVGVAAFGIHMLKNKAGHQDDILEGATVHKMLSSDLTKQNNVLNAHTAAQNKLKAEAAAKEKAEAEKKAQEDERARIFEEGRRAALNTTANGQQ